MSYTLQKLGTIAASGTSSITIQVPELTQGLYVKVNATYSAVSATASGVSAAFQYSIDNGTTYSNSNASSVQAGSGASAANAISSAEQIIRLQNDPFRQDGGPVTHIKVNLTNTDGTNTATVAVTSEAKQYLS